jgi:hypothetical protein
MTAALIEFMSGDVRRKTGERLGLRAKRRSAFAAIAARAPGSAMAWQRLRRKSAEGETDGAASAARTEKEAGKEEGTDS